MKRVFSVLIVKVRSLKINGGRNENSDFRTVSPELRESLATKFTVVERFAFGAANGDFESSGFLKFVKELFL